MLRGRTTSFRSCPRRCRARRMPSRASTSPASPQPLPLGTAAARCHEPGLGRRHHSRRSSGAPGGGTGGPARSRTRCRRLGTGPRPIRELHRFFGNGLPGNRQGPRMYEMQGPCPVSGRWPAGCPAGWRLIDRLLVPDSRRKRRFPGSSCVPGLPPDWCPSPAVTYFYPPGRVRHKGFRAMDSRFFTVHNSSTAEGQLSPVAGAFPPDRPQLSAQAASGSGGLAKPVRLHNANGGGHGYLRTGRLGPVWRRLRSYS
jgi:hypothetical protein